MKMKCEVIQDLLPSYIDKLTSNESNRLVETHLQECEICSTIYNEMKQEISPVKSAGVEPPSDQKLLKRIKRRIVTVITTLAITFTLMGAILGVYGNVLFQEGNPIPVVSSILKLEFSNADYVKFSASPTKYISKFNSAGDRYSIIKEYMKKKGWEFKEQMGSGLIFDKNGEQTVISTRQYTKNYFIWSVPEQQTRP